MALAGTKTFQNYIDGEWVDAASGETFESTSPANGDTIGVFPKSGPDDVDRAVDVAKAAYEDWRLVPAPKRGEVLFRFGALLAEQKSYVKNFGERVIGYGHFVSDDGRDTLGTSFFMQLDDRAAADAFVAVEPMSKAGLYQRVEIHRDEVVHVERYAQFQAFALCGNCAGEITRHRSGSPRSTW